MAELTSAQKLGFLRSLIPYGVNKLTDTIGGRLLGIDPKSRARNSAVREAAIKGDRNAMMDVATELALAGMTGGGLYAGPKAAGFKTAQEEGKVFSNLADKMQRFEIDDSAAQIMKNEGDLGEVLQHPELFEQYPFLKDKIRVQVDPNLEAAGSYQKPNWLGMGEYSPGWIKLKEMKPKTLLHEIQHAIQEKEGFASGGNPNIIDYLDVRASKTELINKINSSPELKKSFRNYQDGLISKAEYESHPLLREYNKLEQMTPYDQYYNLAGEIEARDAAARMNMTPAERLATAPYSSENIPLKDWIVNLMR